MIAASQRSNTARRHIPPRVATHQGTPTPVVVGEGTLNNHGGRQSSNLRLLASGHKPSNRFIEKVVDLVVHGVSA
jgi:hypothetical protein